MCLDDPDKLVFSYTRMMMGFLLFQPMPQDILIIGLGGGSLSKYCYRHLPEARITTVEINQRVIELRDAFVIPGDDERFRVIHADAADYVEDCRQDYDVILLDGFDADGLPQRLSNQRFYDRCADRIRDHGILVANLLEGDWRIASCWLRLRQAFNGHVIGARPVRGYNLILYAGHSREMLADSLLTERARMLDRQYGLNFSDILGKMNEAVRPSWDSARSDRPCRPW